MKKICKGYNVLGVILKAEGHVEYLGEVGDPKDESETTTWCDACFRAHMEQLRRDLGMSSDASGNIKTEGI